jgi:hypothetical protein
MAEKPNPLTGQPLVWITADQLYQLRCSLIHSGSDEIEENKRSGVDRFVFFDQTRSGAVNKFEKCKFKGEEFNIVSLGASEFCTRVFDAAEEWDASVANTEVVQKEKAKLLLLHSAGEVIYGIKFG